MRTPRTRYARNGDVSIAYTVAGHHHVSIVGTSEVAARHCWR
jgi:hypothetical protein